MYNVKIIINNTTINIPIIDLNSKYHDVHLSTLLEQPLNSVYQFIANTKYVIDRIKICLYDDDILLNEEYILMKESIKILHSDNRLSSNINLHAIIEQLFLQHKYYEIISGEDEIIDVIFQNEHVDIQWFINFVYKNFNRYYRKMIISGKMIIFARDI